MSKPESLNGRPHEEVLKAMDEVSFPEYQAYSYVSTLSHFVYATTMLDTFLMDATLFLFLLYPKSIGEKQTVSIETLLECRSTHEAVFSAAKKRSRELSFRSFLDRVKFLQQTFGLQLNIDTPIYDSLEHFSSLRNTVVHDQGFIDLFLNDDGKICSRQKACPMHPTEIQASEVLKALDVYSVTVYAVSLSIFQHVLKVPQGHDFYKDLEELKGKFLMMMGREMPDQPDQGGTLREP